MLSIYQFEVLNAALANPDITQREISQAAGISLGSVNKAYKELRALGFIDGEGVVSATGKEAMQPYKANNAIILAAGVGSRFAPLSFERPKALFEVRDEVLIERQIRQLKEAGIDNIVVVVGYMKELFFYLEDKFNVTLLFNPEYAERNNHSSLWVAKELLGNSYIISGDQYFSHNIFSKYVYSSYCSAAFSAQPTSEATLELDNKNRIVAVEKGGSDAYYMQGPAFFNYELSNKFIEILSREYPLAQTANKLWDDILATHLDELEVYMHDIGNDTVFEFDYITDLTAFDRDFFANVDSNILDNICKTLECTREDITSVEPIKAGLTNLSVLFEVGGTKYVYRHPGYGTEEIVNRESEAYVLNIAKNLGLDETFIYEDPKQGWKISKYIDGCIEFDYRNKDHVKKGLEMARRLHTSNQTSPWSFDFYPEALNIIKLLKAEDYPMPNDFDELEAKISRVAELVKQDQGEPVLCHNDFYGPNFLVRDDDMWLIDWEYAAMGDYACDLGNFISQGSGYTVDESIAILDYYYGRKPTPEEIRHCLAAVAIVGFYWYVWAMYKSACGNPVGDWLYIWYKAAKTYSAAALERYEA